MTVVQAAFSFGRDHDLLRQIEETLEEDAGARLIDLRSDVDANRTWVSVASDHPGEAMMRVCELVFDRVHLEHHVGEHPRLGALDLCSWVGDLDAATGFALELAERFAVPVYLPHKNDAWHALRNQGFGSLFERGLTPDFGPHQVNERLGVIAVWLRPIYLTVVADVEEERADFLKMRVRDIRQRREDGEAMFAGVEAVAYPAPSDARSRIVIEFSDPDNAPPDPVIEWLDRRARVAGLRVQSVEAIGAVRRTDLLETRSIPVRENQVVDL